jgi:hypothetical protein
MVRIIADEFLTEERDRKYYADHYTCCPPPLFILFITLIEVTMETGRSTSCRTDICPEVATKPQLDRYSSPSNRKEANHKEISKFESAYYLKFSLHTS